MSVYTKTGDAGITSLYTGERVSKNSLRVKTYGTVDELNSALAMARAASSNERVKEIILGLQKNNSLLMALPIPSYHTRAVPRIFTAIL